MSYVTRDVRHHRLSIQVLPSQQEIEHVSACRSYVMQCTLRLPRLEHASCSIIYTAIYARSEPYLMNKRFVGGPRPLNKTARSSEVERGRSRGKCCRVHLLNPRITPLDMRQERLIRYVSRIASSESVLVGAFSITTKCLDHDGVRAPGKVHSCLLPAHEARVPTLAIRQALANMRWHVQILAQ